MENTPAAEDASVVVAEALEPIKYSEGPTIGVLGDSRCGKTELIKFLIEEYQRRSPGPVFVQDDKEARPQYEGQYRRDKADVEKNPPDPEGSRVIVLRGDHFGGVDVDPEELAEMQRDLAAKFRMPSCAVYDEAEKACAYGQFKRGNDKSVILWAFKRGKSSGVASIWGSQETQDIPAPMFNQTPIIFCFRMQGAPLRLLKQRGYLEGGVEGVIPTLPGDELPREKRGYFVALRRGRPWDGKISRRFKR